MASQEPLRRSTSLSAVKPETINARQALVKAVDVDPAHLPSPARSSNAEELPLMSAAHSVAGSGLRTTWL